MPCSPAGQCGSNGWQTRRAYDPPVALLGSPAGACALDHAQRAGLVARAAMEDATAVGHSAERIGTATQSQKHRERSHHVRIGQPRTNPIPLHVSSNPKWPLPHGAERRTAQYRPGRCRPGIALDRQSSMECAIPKHGCRAQARPKAQAPGGRALLRAARPPQDVRRAGRADGALAKALGDPIRVQLVDVLRKHAGKVCVCELTPLFDVSQPTRLPSPEGAARRRPRRRRAPRPVGLLLRQPRSTEGAERMAVLRPHLALTVTDVERSIPFYEALFGTEPEKRQARLREVLGRRARRSTSRSPRASATELGAFNHAGIQVADDRGRARREGAPRRGRPRRVRRDGHDLLLRAPGQDLGARPRRHAVGGVRHARGRRARRGAACGCARQAECCGERARTAAAA